MVTAHRGAVLSPSLFTIYTSDFSYNYGTCHLQKFSDDSSIAGRISAEEENRNVVGSLVCWSELYHLKLNISETKELVLDFRKGGRTLTLITIHGDGVETVDSYKYPGVHSNKKLDWKDKKAQSRLHFLRRLRSLNVCSELLAGEL